MIVYSQKSLLKGAFLIRADTWPMMKTLFCVTLTQNLIGNESKRDEKDREPYEKEMLLVDLSPTT